MANLVIFEERDDLSERQGAWYMGIPTFFVTKVYGKGGSIRSRAWSLWWTCVWKKLSIPGWRARPGKDKSWSLFSWQVLQFHQGNSILLCSSPVPALSCWNWAEHPRSQDIWHCSFLRAALCVFRVRAPGPLLCFVEIVPPSHVSAIKRVTFSMQIIIQYEKYLKMLMFPWSYC